MDNNYIKLELTFFKVESNLEEIELENFFINVKNELIILYDSTMIDFNFNRSHFPAVLGDWAWIWITIWLTLPWCILSTLDLWEKIYNKLEEIKSFFQLDKSIYQEFLDKMPIAKFVFEDKNNEYRYVIDNDWEISRFEKIKK